MSAAIEVADEVPAVEEHAESIWGKALYKFRRDRAGVLGLGIVLAYFVAALGVWFGVWGTEWSDVEGPKWGSMSAEHWFGTNIIGQDIFQRSLYSTKDGVAKIGLIVAVLSTILGAVLGAVAGFFNGTWIDAIILLDQGRARLDSFLPVRCRCRVRVEGNPWAMHVAMVSTFWTTTGRLVRGEVIKLKNFEFVEASRAIGVRRLTIIFRAVTFFLTRFIFSSCRRRSFSSQQSNPKLCSRACCGLGVQDGVAEVR